jgi:hypothetical protein
MLRIALNIFIMRALFCTRALFTIITLIKELAEMVQLSLNHKDGDLIWHYSERTVYVV